MTKNTLVFSLCDRVLTDASRIRVLPVVEKKTLRFSLLTRFNVHLSHNPLSAECVSCWWCLLLTPAAGHSRRWCMEQSQGAPQEGHQTLSPWVHHLASSFWLDENENSKNGYTGYTKRKMYVKYLPIAFVVLIKSSVMTFCRTSLLRVLTST